MMFKFKKNNEIDEKAVRLVGYTKINPAALSAVAIIPRASRPRWPQILPKFDCAGRKEAGNLAKQLWSSCVQVICFPFFKLFSQSSEGKTHRIAQTRRKYSFTVSTLASPPQSPRGDTREEASVSLVSENWGESEITRACSHSPSSFLIEKEVRPVSGK